MATDIDFPSQLPCGQRQGYGLQPNSTFARTPMVAGRARQRRTFTNVPTMADVSWIFSPEETVLFEAWYRDAINDGADWFNCELRSPLDGRDNPGTSQYECRFTDIYTGPVPEGAFEWRISAQLEIIERPLIPVGWGLFPELVLGMSLIDIAMNQEWPEP
ncbi:MAG: hypothetical protein V7688_12895 [Alcanivorax jadensis]|uniref:hypothetical protein n=1 Tax=Alcanivorax jadensis TaxID=64988 RepID=UPI003003823E